MTGDDLYEPLKRKPGRPMRRVPVAMVLVGAAFGLAAAATVVVMRNGDIRGEPFAVASITTPTAEPAKPSAAPPAGGGSVIAFTSPAAPAPASGTVDQAVEVEKGVTVVRSTSGSGPLVLKVPQAPEAAKGQALARAPDPRVVEPSPSGPLPRIGKDGSRPDHLYAHAPVAVGGKPAIAILVGGMGLDRQATTDADTLLPGAVSFGFAPYGDDLSAQVLAARQAGHEVILQVPMEGFGPAEASLSHRLTTEGDNEDRLRWLMSRFTGYAGLGNYLGGRLLADEDALRPILQDAANRGLLFVDDGTASRSLAQSVAADMGLPAVRADVVLDAKADDVAMAGSFARLEALARERGVAVGAATGGPETLASLSRLLAEAGRRGIVLIPISQAATLAPPSPLASRAAVPPR